MLFGKYSIDILNDGTMLVDGGIAFSGIDKEQWSEFAHPDEKNRIQFGINYLLVRGPNFNLLMDTGLGTKMQRSKRKIMGLGEPVSMDKKLAPFDLKIEDITHVVFSHLHFDHCAGVTEILDDNVYPVFHNADFVVQKDEWISAVAPDEISGTSYDLKDFLPLQQTGRLKLINGNIEIFEGIFLEVTGGHTKGHQIMKIEDKDKSFLYIADICPTSHHLSAERHEAFDIYPKETISARKKLLRVAEKKKTLVVFPHDLTGNFYRIEEEQNAYKAVKVCL